MIKFLEKNLVPMSTKVSNLTYLKMVSQGSMSLLTVVMLGAIATLLGSITWEPYVRFLEILYLDQVIDVIPSITTGLLGMYMAFSVAYRGAALLGYEQISFTNGILSLVSFMLLIPFNTNAVEGSTFIDVRYLGSRSVITALIVAITVSTLHTKILKKGIIIKMPDGVPPMATRSFEALIPAAIIMLIFSIVRIGFSFTSFENVTDFIYLSLQTPLSNIVGSFPAMLLCLTLAHLFWFFGVHGSMTILPVFMPIWMGFMSENLDAIAAGQPIPHVLNIAMWDLAHIGGAGSTIGLVILMYFKSKSQQYKQLGKITMPCGLFNINEPVIFGLPIMLNPLIIIPFIVTPVIIFSLGYFLINLGIVAPPMGMFGTAALPPIIRGLSQGSLSFAIYEFFTIIISIVIYYPFFKVMDNQAYQNELNTKIEV